MRGIGSEGDEKLNIILLDEAAFVPDKIRNTIIIPLLKRKDATFLTISTLGGMFDGWKRVTESVDKRGRPVFLRKTYSLVCDECMELGIADKCTHRMDMLPPWMSAVEEEKVKAIMSGAKDDWLREAMGVEGSSDFIPGFLQSAIAYLLSDDVRSRQEDEQDGGWNKLLRHDFDRDDDDDDDESTESSKRKRRPTTNASRGGGGGGSDSGGDSDTSAGSDDDDDATRQPSRKRRRTISAATKGGDDDDDHATRQATHLYRKRRRLFGRRITAQGGPILNSLGRTDYPYVFIGLDPAAGSDRSKYAVISLVWEPDGTVVVRHSFFYFFFILAVAVCVFVVRGLLLLLLLLGWTLRGRACVAPHLAPPPSATAPLRAECPERLHKPPVGNCGERIQTAPWRR